QTHNRLRRPGSKQVSPVESRGSEEGVDHQECERKKRWSKSPDKAVDLVNTADAGDDVCHDAKSRRPTEWLCVLVETRAESGERRASPRKRSDSRCHQRRWRLPKVSGSVAVLHPI